MSRSRKVPLNTAVTPNKPAEHAEPRKDPACCQTCSYWQRVDEHYGRCRHLPPSLINPSKILSHGPVVIHGITPADEVCGQHPHFVS